MLVRHGASRCGTLCSEKVLEQEVWLDTVVSRDRATLKSASSLPFSSFELALCCAALPGRGEGRRKPWLSMPRGDRHQHRAKLSTQFPTEPVMGAAWKLVPGCSLIYPLSAASLARARLVDAFSLPKGPGSRYRVVRCLFVSPPAAAQWRDYWACPSEARRRGHTPPRNRRATPIAPDS